nr:MAG TPA: hypothetical protein [Caudoviricetes sp.]
MATEYRINMNRFNGTDYDVMYPRTLTEQVINGQRQIVISSVSLSTTWSGSGPYTQVVTVDGADAKSKVDLQPDSTIIESLSEDGVTAIYIVNDSGTLTAVATGAAPTTALNIQCSIEEVVEYTPPVSNVLDDNSWSTIKWVSNHNLGSNYWSVGATKKITMNGKVSDGLTLTNFETYVYILGFNHNEALEGSGITFGGFKTAQAGGTNIGLVDSNYGSYRESGQWFNMNNGLINTGGWKDSLMRTVTMPLIKSALPSDFSSIIKSIYKYTDNVGGGNGSVESNISTTQDDVFLLGEYEIFGTNTHANTYEASKQMQYNYYVIGNSKIKYKHSNTANVASWWERSPKSTASSTFCRVDLQGHASADGAFNSFGVAPAFVV